MYADFNVTDSSVYDNLCSLFVAFTSLGVAVELQQSPNQNGENDEEVELR